MLLNVNDVRACLHLSRGWAKRHRSKMEKIDDTWWIHMDILASILNTNDFLEVTVSVGDGSILSKVPTEEIISRPSSNTRTD